LPLEAGSLAADWRLIRHTASNHDHAQVLFFADRRLSRQQVAAWNDSVRQEIEALVQERTLLPAATRRFWKAAAALLLLAWLAGAIAAARNVAALVAGAAGHLPGNGGCSRTLVVRRPPRQRRGERRAGSARADATAGRSGCGRGVGYSRPLPGEKAKQFHGFEKDIHSVGDFIRLYTTRAGRWGSPKFLIGESYGTTRAAGLSGYLQERHGMYLNGIMLISSVLDFGTLLFQPGNDLPYLLFLPTYAATAHYHRRLSGALQGLPLADLVDEVRAFALGDYASALLQGHALPAEEEEQIARRVAGYIGVSEDFVLRHNLRVPIFRFTKELRRDEGLTVGRLDSRFTGADRDRGGERFEYDPSYAVIQGPYTATFNDYVRRQLEFESDTPYEILTDRVHPWSYEKFQNAYVYVAETLRKAMNVNPYLKVFVGNGYYDLATPFLATEYTFKHLMLPPERRGDVTMAYYEAGHMMYVQQQALAQVKADLAAFLDSAL
jgi:carboxypeptidase C (cathepsin A)